jgi:hypothetical protein
LNKPVVKYPVIERMEELSIGIEHRRVAREMFNKET